MGKCNTEGVAPFRDRYNMPRNGVEKGLFRKVLPSSRNGGDCLTQDIRLSVLHLGQHGPQVRPADIHRHGPPPEPFPLRCSQVRFEHHKGRRAAHQPPPHLLGKGLCRLGYVYALRVQHHLPQKSLKPLTFRHDSHSLLS